VLFLIRGVFSPNKNSRKEIKRAETEKGPGMTQVGRRQEDTKKHLKRQKKQVGEFGICPKFCKAKAREGSKKGGTGQSKLPGPLCPPRGGRGPEKRRKGKRLGYKSFEQWSQEGRRRVL